jgi:hypothetical protein
MHRAAAGSAAFPGRLFGSPAANLAFPRPPIPPYSPENCTEETP